LTHTALVYQPAEQAPKPATAEVVEQVNAMDGAVRSRPVEAAVSAELLPAASAGDVSESVYAPSALWSQMSVHEDAPAAAVSQVLFAAS
jgi:hypothetical protein